VCPETTYRFARNYSCARKEKKRKEKKRKEKKRKEKKRKD
jgi:hypothetical protein